MNDLLLVYPRGVCTMRSIFFVASFLAILAGVQPLAAEPVTAPIKLFNGKDLANFYTYLGAPAKGEKGWSYDPAAPAKVFAGGPRINWYGRDPGWKDVQGFRGKDDVEHPAGQWNTLECVCAGDTITNILNGKVVNRGTNSSHTKGKILFQSEGAEVFFRKIELLPLKK